MILILIISMIHIKYQPASQGQPSYEYRSNDILGVLNSPPTELAYILKTCRVFEAPSHYYYYCYYYAAICDYDYDLVCICRATESLKPRRNELCSVSQVHAKCAHTIRYYDAAQSARLMANYYTPDLTIMTAHRAIAVAIATGQGTILWNMPLTNNILLEHATSHPSEHATGNPRLLPRC